MSAENNNDDEIAMETKNDVLLEFTNIIENELALIKIYDFVSFNPFDLIYQEKSLEILTTKKTTSLFGLDSVSENIDGGRLFIKEEFNQLKVKEKTKQIIQNAEDVARENGIKDSLNKRLMKIQYLILAISFGLYLLLSIIPSFESFGSIFLIIAMVISCSAPQFFRKKLKLSWDEFKKNHTEELIARSLEITPDIKIFVQDLLNDARDRILANKIPLEKIQFILLSKDYQNVNFVRIQGGLNGSPVNSIYQFSYPEGMAPTNEISKSNQVYEDDNDSFILLKNATFSDDGKLVDFIAEYPSKADHELPDALLSSSKFETIKNPSLVIPEFDSNEKIVCECGELIKFSELKNCTSKLHSKFEFYLAIGEKCKVCQLNPFVLINSPGNEKIPDGLEKIFQ